MTENNNVTRTEFDTISAIVTRTIREHPSLSRRLDLMMDLEYTHQCIPMDLDQFLNFDAGNFNHDIGGIVANFNRETLKMDNCFVPRCALPEQASS